MSSSVSFNGAKKHNIKQLRIHVSILDCLSMSQIYIKNIYIKPKLLAENKETLICTNLTENTFVPKKKKISLSSIAKIHEDDKYRRKNRFVG